MAAPRLAYVLGEIMEMSVNEAAAVLEIEGAALRKRLQRARERIESFMARACGLVTDDAACRCDRRIVPAFALGRASVSAPRFATHPSSFAETRAVVQRVEAARRAVTAHRTSQPREIPRSTSPGSSSTRWRSSVGESEIRDGDNTARGIRYPCARR